MSQTTAKSQASKANKRLSSADARGSEADESLNELFSFLHTYGSSDGFASLKTKIDTAEKTQIAYSTNVRELSLIATELSAQEIQHTKNLDREKQRAESAESQLEALKSQLTDKTRHVGKQEKQLQSLIVEVKKKDLQLSKLEAAEVDRDRLTRQIRSIEQKLETTSLQLQSAEKTLATLGSFREDFDSLEVKKDQLCEALASMFDIALGFFKESFHQDLDHSCLVDAGGWKSVKTHRSMRQDAIPLPLSNSAAAREMRVSTGLMVYAWALHEHVLRPTFVSDDNRIDEFLEELERRDRLHEAYARAVLLKLSPDMLKRNENRRIENAVTETVEALSCWLPDEPRQRFEAGLRQVTRDVCTKWSFLQRLQEKVKPTLERSFFLDDWMRLQLTPAPAASKDLSPPTQSGRSDLKKQDKAVPNLQTVDKAAVIIWPAFLFVPQIQGDADSAPEADERLHHGYILTQSQMSVAEDEVSRKAERRASRQNALANPKTSRYPAIFLSLGGQSGSGAG